MSKSTAFLLASFLLSLQLMTSHAVDYPITNKVSDTAGGARFKKEIGAPYATTVARSATSFIWGIFDQSDPADRKKTQTVPIFIDNVDGVVAYTSADEIHVSQSYIEGYAGDVKTEFTGVLYHEMTHVWQWNGKGQANGGLIEGIADYVRLKAGYAPSHWVQAGQGDMWDQGYDVTAKFLDYCDELKSGFVAELNKKMRKGYNDSYFVDLLGKPVDQLFAKYKAKYNTN